MVASFVSLAILSAMQAVVHVDDVVEIGSEGTSFDVPRAIEMIYIAGRWLCFGLRDVFCELVTFQAYKDPIPLHVGNSETHPLFEYVKLI